MLTVTAANLFAIAPGADPGIIAGIVENQHYAAAAGILDSAPRAERFFAQLAHESAGYTRLVESLNYATGARIRQVWPSRFPTEDDAAAYVRQPQKLANKVYGGRLGNTSPNDGWVYRGRGLIQNTGRANYVDIEIATGMPVIDQPELLAQFPGAMTAAVSFWTSRRLTALADRGAPLEDETRIINGGLNGIDDRRIYFNRARKVAWGDGARAPAPAQAEYTRRGDSGAKVRQIQETLRAKGFYKAATIYGLFGEMTEDAVRAFQTSRGLLADGVVGPRTWTVLMAPIEAPVARPEPSRAPDEADDAPSGMGTGGATMPAAGGVGVFGLLLILTGGNVALAAALAIAGGLSIAAAMWFWGRKR